MFFFFLFLGRKKKRRLSAQSHTPRSLIGRRVTVLLICYYMVGTSTIKFAGLLLEEWARSWVSLGMTVRFWFVLVTH